MFFFRLDEAEPETRVSGTGGNKSSLRQVRVARPNQTWTQESRTPRVPRIHHSVPVSSPALQWAFRSDPERVTHHKANRRFRDRRGRRTLTPTQPNRSHALTTTTLSRSHISIISNLSSRADTPAHPPRGSSHVLPTRVRPSTHYPTLPYPQFTAIRIQLSMSLPPRLLGCITRHLDQSSQLTSLRTSTPPARISTLSGSSNLCTIIKNIPKQAALCCLRR